MQMVEFTVTSGRAMVAKTPGHAWRSFVRVRVRAHLLFLFVCLHSYGLLSCCSAHITADGPAPPSS